MKIAREGLLFILPTLVLAALSAVPGWWPTSAFFALLAAAFVFFFRDPARRPPEGEHLVVSPADGKVVRIDSFSTHPDLPGPVRRVCIFLSLYDVHLTRAPLSGDVRRVDYHSGKFFPAYRDEASELNESNGIYLAGGRTPLFVKQIVGVAARRIKCFVKAGDTVARGQLFFSFVFLTAGVLRLARFNVRTKALPDRKFYQGLTVPSAAMFMAGLPFLHPAPIESRELAFLFALLAVFVSFCMISTLPYRNFTNLLFNRKIDIRTALFVAIVLSGLIFYPKIFLIVFFSLNLFSGPVIGIARALKKTPRQRLRRKEIPS